MSVSISGKFILQKVIQLFLFLNGPITSPYNVTILFHQKCFALSGQQNCQSRFIFRMALKQNWRRIYISFK